VIDTATGKLLARGMDKKAIRVLPTTKHLLLLAGEHGILGLGQKKVMEDREFHEFIGSLQV
jgi:hypothetical protein